jgi:prepilin-type N-terminal cleavage/methylation domain-containing protein
MQRGFTLIELMIVAAIIAGVTSLGLLMYARIARGDKAPSFARSILALSHEARQIATASGLPTRLRLSPTGAMTVSSEQWNGAAWIPLNTMTRSAADIELCTPRVGMVLDGTGPNQCPLGSDYFICFQPNGNSWFDAIAGTSCSGTVPQSTAGSTIYVRTGDATGTGATVTGAHHYKIVIWYLTGMPKLYDTGTAW